MASRDISVQTGQIASGKSLNSEAVRDALNLIVSWMTTTAGLGIGNGDIATDAVIASSKSYHSGMALNSFLDVGHASDGSHTFADNGCDGLYLRPDSSNPTIKVNIDADALTLEDSDTATVKIADVSTSANITAGQVEGGDLTGSTEAASTTYYLIVLWDSANETATGVLYTGSSLSTTFWETDLPAFNTAVGGGAAYDYAKIVGLVFNDANEDFECPRVIGGGTVGDLYSATPSLIATGDYAGSGSGQTVTGLGFLPDYIYLIGLAADYSGVIWMSDMDATYSKVVAGAYSTTRITAVDYDEFTVGTPADTSGVTYQYIAMKKHEPDELTP